jgi:aminoglycoside phosphotransferase (APT) family kinase protein
MCSLIVQAYHLPPGMSAIARLPSPLPPGVPTEREYVQQYCTHRGIEPPSQQTWAFYVALALFRAAAILAGVHARAQQGNASASNAWTVGSPKVVGALAHTALDFVQRSGGGSTSASGAALQGVPARPSDGLTASRGSS